MTTEETIERGDRDLGDTHQTVAMEPVKFWSGHTGLSFQHFGGQGQEEP